LSQRESGLVRLGTVWTAVLCLLPQTAVAAQVSSGMGVGIIIDDVAPGKSSRSRALGRIAVMKAVPTLTYTWNAAALSVKSAGFQHPRRKEKSPVFYWFEAQRHGGYFRIAVSIASGKVIKIIRA